MAVAEVRSIYVLTREEIVRTARDLADSGERMHHGYDAGSPQALAFEHAYIERQRELDALQAEQV